MKRCVLGVIVMVLASGCATMSDLSGLSGGDDPPPPPPPVVPPGQPDDPVLQPPPPALASTVDGNPTLVRGAETKVRVTVTSGQAPFTVHFAGLPAGVHAADTVLDAPGSVDVTLSAEEEATEGTGDLVAAVDDAAHQHIDAHGVLLVRGPAGALDRTFGTRGLVLTSFGESGAGALSLALLPNGKILAAGSGNTDYQLARYTDRGLLDTSFDGDGKATMSWPTTNPGWTYAKSVVVENDGHFIVAGIVDLSRLGLARYDATGALDVSYGNNGRVLSPASGAGDGLTAAMLDAEGRVLVAGYTQSPGSYDAMVGRYTPSGAADSTFASGGRAVSALSDAGDFANAVAVQSDGKVLVASQSASADALSYDAVVQRFTAVGAKDFTFGSPNGFVRFDVTASSLPAALAVDDSSIYVTGGGTGDTWVARLTIASGSIVWKKTLPRAYADGPGETVLDMKLDAEGRIVLSGWADNGSNTDFMVRRLTADGELDASFGKNGTVATDVSGLNDYAAAVRIQPDGRIVVAGKSDSAGGLVDFSLARYWP